MSNCKDFLNSIQDCLLPVVAAERPGKMEHGILLNPLVLCPLTEVVGVHHQLLPPLIRDSLRLQALPHEFDYMYLQRINTSSHVGNVLYLPSTRVHAYATMSTHVHKSLHGIIASGSVSQQPCITEPSWLTGSTCECIIGNRELGVSMDCLVQTLTT